jgi:hypothetical protein
VDPVPDPLLLRQSNPRPLIPTPQGWFLFLYIYIYIYIYICACVVLFSRLQVSFSGAIFKNLHRVASRSTIDVTC